MKLRVNMKGAVLENISFFTEKVAYSLYDQDGEFIKTVKGKLADCPIEELRDGVWQPVNLEVVRCR